MWDRIKGTATTHLKRERDIDEANTIASRALLRFYGQNRPDWLADAAEAVDGRHIGHSIPGATTVRTTIHSVGSHVSAPFTPSRDGAASPRSGPTTSLHDILGRRPSRPGTPASEAGSVNSPSLASSRPGSPDSPAGRRPLPRSGIASKLKKANW